MRLRAAFLIGLALFVAGGIARAENCGNVSFPEAPWFMGGRYITSVTPADFNGDGAPDLLVTNGGPSIIGDRFPGVVIFVNDGHGRFSQGPVVSANLYVMNAVAGDFDGDRAPDVLLQLEDTHALVLFLNRGDRFVQAGTFDLGKTALSVQAVDFNGDSHLDVVATAGSVITLMFGRGDGTFEQRTFTPPEGLGGNLAIADVNRDGRLDLVYPVRSPREIVIRHGGPAGEIGEARTIPLSGQPYSVLVADFDGDGRLDALTNGSPAIYELARDVDRATTASLQPIAQQIGSSTDFVAAADFDGDGAAEVVTSGSRVATLGKRDTFAVQPFWYFTADRVNIGPTVDLDGDGRMDIVTVNRQVVSLLFNRGSRFEAPTSLGRSTVLAAADLDGDGIDDLINQYGSVVSFGNGDGTYRDGAFVFVLPSTSTVTSRVADFDGDGHPDVAVVISKDYSSTRGDLSLLMGRGGDSFEIRHLGFFGYRNAKLRVLDLDADHKLDLLVTSKDPGTPVSIMWGNGDGTFSAPSDVSVPAGAELAMVGDLNGDNLPDLIIGDYRGSAVLVNDGRRSFVVTSRQAQYSSTSALADLNRDGKADLVYADSGIAYVAPGVGDGTFGRPATTALSLSRADTLDVADMNDDGTPDLVVSDLSTTGSTNHFAVLLGDGHGGLRPARYWWTDHPTRVLDMNHDGRPEVLQGSVVRWNQCSAGALPRRRSAPHQ